MRQDMIKLNHDFAKFIDPEYYAEIIKGNDEVGCLLRLQLISERFLDVYLSERIPADARSFFQKNKNGAFLKYFNEKLMISISFGLPVELGESLRYLNKIRNEFGHNLDKKLNAQELKEYMALVDGFRYKAAVPYAAETPIKDVVVLCDGKHLNYSDGFAIGFVISTFCLMTRAGLWLVSDLQSRGALKLG